MEVAARRGARPSPGAAGPVLAPAAPASPRHAGAHGADRRRHRGRPRRLAGAGALGHPGRVGAPAGAAEVGRRAPAATPVDPGQHQHPRRDRHDHQRRVPRRRHQQPGRQGGLRRGQGVQRADPRRSTSTSNQINNSGGINGRKINPIIVQFDPTNDANMQSLCSQWTQGNPAVFAVVDGIGTWEQDNQLCVTQQGHTPLISAWSTTTELDQPRLALPVVDRAPTWPRCSPPRCSGGVSSGRLGHGKKVGVVVSDQAADQAALNDYLLPDLKKAGITPMVADGGRQPATRRRRPTPTRSWPWRSSRRPACSR